MLAFGKPPSDTALRGVLEALEARAIYGGEVHPVCIRRYRRADVDYLTEGPRTGLPTWSTAMDWRIVARPPPIRFLRPAEWSRSPRPFT